MRKLFITGIGTDVGKTLVASILTEALEADYWKPIQSGNHFTTDSEQVKSLISNAKTIVHPEAYLLQNPISPHAAAELEGINIDLNSINLPKTTNNNIVIEGAGGLMVPINKTNFIADVIKKLDAEVVLVIQNYLGSINHSLLTIEGLKNRNLNILGIVFNGTANEKSENIILSHCGLNCIGRIAKEVQINKDTVKKYSPAFQNLNIATPLPH